MVFHIIVLAYLAVSQIVYSLYLLLNLTRITVSLTFTVIMYSLYTITVLGYARVLSCCITNYRSSRDEINGSLTCFRLVFAFRYQQSRGRYILSPPSPCEKSSRITTRTRSPVSAVSRVEVTFGSDWMLGSLSR